MKSTARTTRAAIGLALLLATTPPLTFAATFDTYIGPNNGLWSSPANWSLNAVPDNSGGQTFDVFLTNPGPLTTLLNTSVIIDTLTIAPQNALTLQNGNTLTLAGSVLANSGTLLLNATGPATTLLMTADTSFSGHGTVTLAGTANQIIPTISGLRLTSDNTISGGGTLGNSLLKLTNNSLIAARNGVLFLNTALAADAFLNNGTLQANAGILNLTGGTITNAGVVEALTSSTVTLTASVIGGTLRTTGSGVITVSNATLQGLALAGNIALPLGASAVLVGPVTNAGTITAGNFSFLTLTGGLKNTGALLNSGELDIAGDAFLTGPGTVTLNNTSSRISATTLIGSRLTSDNVIAGFGTVGNGNIKLTNNNLISATGGTLNITPYLALDSLINNGTLQASTGVLNLQSGTITNLGTIEALTNATITLGASITGGLIRALGTGVITVTNTCTLQNTTLAAAIAVNSGFLALAGATTNTGSLTASNGTNLFAAGALNNTGLLQLNFATLNLVSDLTLAGNGTLSLANVNSRITSNSVTTRLTSSNVISGFGTLGTSSLKITNNNLISATGGTLFLSPYFADSILNNGTIQANNGVLSILGGAVANAGVIESLPGSTLSLGASVTGGIIRTVGSGVLLLNGVSNIQDATLAGAITLAFPSALSFIGPVYNTGTLTTAPSNVFNLSRTFINTGLLQLITTGITLTSDASLTGGGAVTLSGIGARISANPVGARLDTDNTISGYGTLGFSNLKINNSGAIIATGGTLALAPTFAADSLLNSGTLRADTAGLLFVTGGTLHSSGALQAINGGTLFLAMFSADITGPISLTNGTLLINTTTASTRAISGTGSITLQTGTLTSDSVSAALLLLNTNVFHTIRPFGSTPIASKLTTLTLAGTTNNWQPTLDLTANPLILQPSPATKAAALATLTNQLAFSLTSPTHAGITSSTVLADPTHKTLLLIDNALANFTTFFSQQVDANSLLVLPTWLGDSNLDQKVNVTDLGTLATYYGQSTGAFGPLHGDFNNDGIVNVTDLGMLATNYGAGTAPGSTFSLDADLSSLNLPPSSFPTTIPEPITLALLTLPLLLKRPRKPSPRPPL